MARIVHIAASPRDESYSGRLAEAFLDACRQARPEDRIETLDLFEADMREAIGAARKIASDFATRVAQRA